VRGLTSSLVGFEILALEDRATFVQYNSYCDHFDFTIQHRVFIWFSPRSELLWLRRLSKSAATRQFRPRS